MKSISILGSTGSIGTQALEIVRLHPELFRVKALTAHRSKELLFRQVREFRPEVAGLTEEIPQNEIPSDLNFCKFVMGKDALHAAASQVDSDMVLVSIVGIAGLPAVLDAIRSGKQVLLANKEALVTGGALVMDAVSNSGKILLPVDSEHSAIFQCLQAAQGNTPKRILLTASGGPFRTWQKEKIFHASRQEALNHPNWSMGAKITIDSASMFNKALEIIEARWLFDMNPDDIQVVVHPQSIIHSAVEFADGAVIAQLGVPDMRVPIAYAMNYPNRITTGTKPLDLFALGQVTFEEGDPERFPALRIVRQCLAAGGASCCIMNGANEAAVAHFLEGHIPFGKIPELVESTLDALGTLPADSIQDVYNADALARRKVEELLTASN